MNATLLMFSALYPSFFLLNSFDLIVSFIYLFIFHLLFRVLLFFLPASRVAPSDAALVILSRKLEQISSDRESLN